MLNIVVMAFIAHVERTDAQVRQGGIVYYVLGELIAIEDAESIGGGDTIIEFGLGDRFERICFLLSWSWGRWCVDFWGGLVEAVV